MTFFISVFYQKISVQEMLYTPKVINYVNLEKTMNHKFLWFIIGVLVLVAIAGVFYWQISQKSPIPDNQSQTRNWQTYDNTQYNYEIRYPAEFQLNPQTAGTIVSIPRNLYPKTNFGQANLSVNLYFNGESACKNYTFNNSMIFPGKQIRNEVLNSNIFYTLQYDSAGAGTTYKTRLYRIFRDNVCYEINLTVGIGDIGNYPPDTVIGVDENDIWNKLSQVLGTFKFIKDR
ncbi:MAG: hypothetical protein A3H60_00660 [Candidatus Zambryskibacteria bacterium RIFCSPLOWO2_02_FULL_44_12b]|nr:MAG: hypothetical protein A3H60_00660 [Candidatus Zambryskibacteria bacterium RIFCSPLOWO2_02_FULL_44_12b]